MTPVSVPLSTEEQNIVSDTSKPVTRDLNEISLTEKLIDFVTLNKKIIRIVLIRADIAGLQPYRIR